MDFKFVQKKKKETDFKEIETCMRIEEERPEKRTGTIRKRSENVGDGGVYSLSLSLILSFMNFRANLLSVLSV